jgi:hypothetical protein
MARPKKISAADMMELDAKRMLRGALGKLGGPERLGELLAELGDNSADMPSTTPESIRARVLTELARLLGQYGGEGSAGGLADAEALDAYIAQHEAKQPLDAEDGEPFDDDPI